MRSDPQRGVTNLLANLPFLFETIAKFFVPLNYTATPVFSWFYTGLGIFFTLMLFFVAIRKAGNISSLVIFGSVWFILLCLPNMYVRLQSTEYSYDYLIHRAYLPIAGLLIALLAMVPEKLVGFDRRWKVASLGFLLVFLAVFSFISGKKYQNGIAFWQSAIESNPDRAEFHHFLSRYYYKQHDNKLFEKYLREAIALKENPMYLNNMGALYFSPDKNYDTAFRYFSRAYQIGYSDTDYKGNYFNLCMVSAQEAFTNKNYQKAADRCLIAVQLDPSNAVAPYNLGLYYIYLGENKKAAAMWRRAINVNPEMLEAYRSLYMYYLNNTKLQDSINYFEGQIKIHEAKANPLPASR